MTSLDSLSAQDAKRIRGETESAVSRMAQKEKSSSKTFNSAKDIRAKGWLHKQGGSIKTWKKRWFVLGEDTIKYYVDAPVCNWQRDVVHRGMCCVRKW